MRATTLSLLFILLLVSSCFADPMALRPAYAQLTENNESGSVITVATGGTYYPWVSAEVGVGTGSSPGGLLTTATGNPSTITANAGAAGAYVITYHMSFDMEAGALVHTCIQKNGDNIIPTLVHVQSSAAGKTSKFCSSTTLVQVASGDVFRVAMTSDSDADEITVYHGYLGAARFAAPKEQ